MSPADQASAITNAEALVAEAKALRGTIGSKLGLARARADRLRKAKGVKALAAATGDDAAKEALAKANESLLRAGLEAEDLAEAERQAAVRVGEAEAALSALRDREKADQLERLSEELREAACWVDQALEALAAAFEQRKSVADQLFRLAPTVARDASLRLIGDGAGTRAARRCGLHRFLRIPRVGEQHHEVALASAHPIPEVLELVAQLRGSESKREAA